MEQMFENDEHVSLSFEFTSKTIEKIFLVDADGEHIDVVLHYEGLLEFIHQNYIP